MLSLPFAAAANRANIAPTPGCFPCQEPDPEPAEPVHITVANPANIAPTPGCWPCQGPDPEPADPVHIQSAS